MILARQSTALIVIVGPVLDADGVAVTDCVVGDFKASKNGAAPAGLNGSATLTHRNTGHYSLSLTTTDSNTVGTLEIVIDDTVNACPVKEIQVLEEAIYDALCAASANAFSGAAGSTKVTGVVLTDTVTTYTGNTPQTGDAFARLGAPAGASVSADVAAVKTQTGAIETDTQDIQSRLPTALVSGRMDSSVGAMANNVLTAAAINPNAINAAKLDPDVTTELQANLALEATAQSIKGKTDNLPTDPADQSLVIAATDAVMARLGAPAGASVSADVAAVKSDTGAIKTKTDALPADPASQAAILAKLPAALVGGRMASNAEVVLDKTGYALTSGERDAIAAALLDLADSIETGATVRKALRAIAATLAGDVTGGPDLPVHKGIGVGTNRVSSTADTDGNRTVVLSV